MVHIWRACNAYPARGLSVCTTSCQSNLNPGEWGTCCPSHNTKTSWARASMHRGASMVQRVGQHLVLLQERRGRDSGKYCNMHCFIPFWLGPGLAQETSFPLGRVGCCPVISVANNLQKSIISCILHERTYGLCTVKKLLENIKFKASHNLCQ